jgi:hypothetical protein
MPAEDGAGTRRCVAWARQTCTGAAEGRRDREGTFVSSARLALPDAPAPVQVGDELAISLDVPELLQRVDAQVPQDERVVPEERTGFPHVREGLVRIPQGGAQDAGLEGRVHSQQLREGGPRGLRVPQRDAAQALAHERPRCQCGPGARLLHPQSCELACRLLRPSLAQQAQSKDPPRVPEVGVRLQGAASLRLGGVELAEGEVCHGQIATRWDRADRATWPGARRRRPPPGRQRGDPPSSPTGSRASARGPKRIALPSASRAAGPSRR